jgi:hypothetical protein
VHIPLVASVAGREAAS